MKKKVILAIVVIVLILIFSMGIFLIKKNVASNEVLIKNESNSVKVHVCTDSEKQAEICTMDYSPVCSNKKTYSNGCVACSSGVYSWTIGECNSKKISAV